MDKLIRFSILIPMYNGAKFLPRLLDSLLMQDIPSDEYEIICIDDCSTDNTVDVVQKYILRYPNIRIIINEKNSRCATNVNRLIAAANGKYFWIFGQDDYAETDCLGMLWERLEREQLDVLLFNYRRVSMDERMINEPIVFCNSSRQTGIELLHNQFGKRGYRPYLLGYEWRAIYRRNFWNDHSIRCVDGLNYEDTIIMLKAIVYSNAVASIDSVLYNYRVNENSVTFKNFRNKKADYIYEFSFLVGQEEEDFYSYLQNVDSWLAKELLIEISSRYNKFCFDLVRTNREQKLRFYKLVSDNKLSIRTKRHWLNWKSRLLLTPVLGFIISRVCELGYCVIKICK